MPGIARGKTRVRIVLQKETRTFLDRELQRIWYKHGLRIGLSELMELLVEQHRCNVDRALTQEDEAIILLFKEREHVRKRSLLGRSATGERQLPGAGRVPQAEVPGRSAPVETAAQDFPADDLEQELGSPAGLPWADAG